MEDFVHWLWDNTHGFGIDIVAILAGASLALAARLHFNRQLITLLHDTPTAMVALDASSGCVLDANTEALQLLAIRRVGEKYLLPDTVSNDELIKLMNENAKSRQSTFHHNLSLSEHHDIVLTFSGRKTRYQGKSVWITYLTPYQLSEREQTEAQQSLVIAKRVLDSISQPVFFTDKVGELMGTNRAFEQFWKGRAEEGENSARQLSKQRHSQQRWTTSEDGQSCLLETRLNSLTNDNGDVIGTIGISYDVTDWHHTQQALRDEMERSKDTEIALAQRDTILQSILEASPDPIGLFNQNRIYEACNQPYVEALGVAKPNDLIGKRVEEVVSRDAYMRYKDSDDKVMQEGTTLRYIDRVERTSGDTIWYDVVKAPYRNPASGTNGVLVMARDVTERFLVEEKLEKANRELEKLSFIDGLTKVANRRRFDEQLELLWRLHVRQQKSLTVMLCDVDHFKDYNDNYGHQRGDSALIELAATFEKVLSRSSDCVARYGGEEFAFILPDTSSEGAINVAQNIQQSVHDLNIAHEHSPVSDRITISIGIVSCVPAITEMPSQLISMADQALYKAKQKGRNQSQMV
ncbi:putative PAS and GGDEF domains protein [Vibrio nigripulchritudo MADA3029]|uniref:diguanylate cyclase n=1 Tax=Vibrio nigripulchritudo TaxID=28173 RepID=U4K1G8_9VIBR|nr:diguanylate cyclase [Vibrio nigripulchritudo]CCN45413.1 putative PAS and GGDEF domains protein [Vibrio nigripulchritudo MADA3020]CCN53704.1 putative PAS and GGDEF domains protein [Vibrio nigripulchritudo MADA3021]CCN58592.1 putative PAS and GGDEF domains protein [Vibrio nigripulchritudo MADA3029]CCN80496.1 putative PAS and GGDEF domains protein [Vibrio nigripulchritudo BLFn1]CCN88252.1 putative PAS and GGDEF domains protein [Vibrio nigripulchritudo SFn27]